ncbi:hypothetical protein [Halorubrum sp. SP9]|uniref:hypothetical protein n=1 Tax=Halorubrum sp. SP9 TaxID=1537267 RepID=UPI00130514E0|nr:hypothetical protein [Halorubrum sp. SP9]
MWEAHRHLGVSIVDSQAEWTPLQKMFLQAAADEWGNDEDIPDLSSVNAPSSSRL